MLIKTLLNNVERFKSLYWIRFLGHKFGLRRLMVFQPVLADFPG